MKFAIVAALTLPACLMAQAAGEYVGSDTCATCHDSIYQRWRTTRMANVVVDPAQRPEVVVGDFSTPNPLVTFSLDDVAFVYGSKWKQRYFTKRGDDYYVFPAQWDVANRVWRNYHPGPAGDWWVQYYPDDQMQRPTGPLCDGCHSTNYNIQTKQVSEWNVGCEKCHGPGGAHARNPSADNIVNPAKLDFVRANDVCIQCHSQGQPLDNPIGGVYYDWPVGFTAGERLSDYWRLEEHKLGETSFTHYPEGSAHKNRMQGNDFVESVMYTRGVRCFTCHDVHGTENQADLVRPGNALCLQCHGSQSPAGPRGALPGHTHHAATSTGSECTACHMPRIAQTIADQNVRSHTFRFIPPQMTTDYNVANACTTCHTGESVAWAEEQMKSWEQFSPWRVVP